MEVGVLKYLSFGWVFLLEVAAGIRGPWLFYPALRAVINDREFLDINFLKSGTSLGPEACNAALVVEGPCLWSSCSSSTTF